MAYVSSPALRALYWILCGLMIALSGCQPSYKAIATRNLLIRLKADTEMSIIASAELPSDIRSLVNRLNEESRFEFDEDYASRRRIDYPGIETGVDAWGRELLMDVRGSTVSIRSKGANGRDDKGRGDDIQVSLECERFLRKGEQGTKGKELKGRNKGDAKDFRGW